MRFQILFFITILSFSIIFTACENQSAVNNSAENKTAIVNSNNPLATVKTPEAATANAAPTLAPVVQNYYDALKKRDDAALRKILSQATLKSDEADMKEEKKTSLSAFITETEIVPDKAVEVRNEKIEGDTGIAEIRGGSYAVWTPVKFVRENGEWKMTNESPDVESVRKSADSNSAK
ncbi:MAG: hypothetical protein ACR2N3_17795 [Pyrinomonadaceae bacterium]